MRSTKQLAALVLAVFLVVFLAPVLAPAAVAQAAAVAPAAGGTPEELARELVRVTGGGNLGKQVMAQLVAAFRKTNPDVPGAFWDEVLASTDAAQIEELVVPVYVKNLTPEEMTAAIAFYKTPAGQGLVKKLPAITQESLVAGQQWGQKVAREVSERLAKYKQAHPQT